MPATDTAADTAETAGTIVVLKNARAGPHRRLPDARALAARFGPRARGIETSSPAELADATAEIARAAPALVIVCGGDGTVTHTLSALLHAYGDRPLPPLSFLPGGTVNVVARGLGATGRFEGTVRRLVTAMQRPHGPLETRRTAIQLPSHGLAGLLFGVGLFANFLDLYRTQRAGVGRAAGLLARLSAEALAGRGAVHRLFAPFDAAVTVDGTRWPRTRWTNVSAGGIESLGFGFAPYIRATERPNAFHLIAHALTPLAALRELPGIRLGRGMQDVSQDIASNVLIEADRPLRFGFDGETFDACTRFELRAGPWLRLVMP